MPLRNSANLCFHRHNTESTENRELRGGLEDSFLAIKHLILLYIMNPA